jgi:hypothetical protein
MTPDNKNFNQIEEKVDLKETHRAIQATAVLVTMASLAVGDIVYRAIERSDTDLFSLITFGAGSVAGTILGTVGVIHEQKQINSLNREIKVLKEKSSIK